jgi:hypothetical protein
MARTTSTDRRMRSLRNRAAAVVNESVLPVFLEGRTRLVSHPRWLLLVSDCHGFAMPGWVAGTGTTGTGTGSGTLMGSGG